MGHSPKDDGAEAPGYERFVVKRFSAVLGRLFGRDWPWLLAVVVVAFVAAWPVISQPGLLNTRGGGDSPFLLQRLHQLTIALADGHFPVRWMPDANYGYGYPFYNYYAPLSIYIAAIFRALGFSFVRAIHLAQLAGFLVAGLGTFYLGRSWLGSRWAGLLAAVAYTVGPFHMVNVYVRGDSLAEFWAMVFYPLVLLAADGLVGIKNYELGIRNEESTPAIRAARPIAVFALAYAGLILSHNISALIFSPFLLLYLLIQLLTADRRPWTTDDMPPEVQGGRGAGEPVVQAFLPAAERRRPANFFSPLHPFSPAPLLFILCALLLALALAAWFFVPALAERDLAQLGPVTEGYFHYSNHFRGLDLVQGGLIFDYNPDGGVAFRLGLVQVGLALAGAVALLFIWRRGLTQRRQVARDAKNFVSSSVSLRLRVFAFFSSPMTSTRVVYVLIGALVATFMITPLSRPLWDHLPLLPFTQFPWRFLSVAALFTSLLAGALVLATERPAGRAAITILGGLVLLAAGLLGLRTDYLILTDADVTAERLAQYEWFTGNIGTTVSAEYLTPESTPRPWTSAWLNTGERDRVVALQGELLAAQLTERWATRQNWDLDVARFDTTVLFPTMNWPNWIQPFDSYNVYMDTQPGSGLMSTPLPKGEQTIFLTLRRTPIRIGAELLSFWAVLMVTMLWIIGGRPSAVNVIRAVAALGVVVALIALLGFLWRDDPRELSPGDLTWDFAQMAYLHHDVGGVAFENGARLHQYGYSGEEVMVGETFTVTLSVEPGDGRPATLALATPASARPTPDGAAEPPLIASDTQPLDSETVVFTLLIPPGAPPGLYVPRLTIDGARPLMPSGATRGDLFLRPVRVVEAGEQGSGGAGEQGRRGAGVQTNDQQPTTNNQQPTTNDRLDVRATSLTMRDATTLDGHFAWYTERPLGARYQFSWRLQDAAGGILAQLDAQPGYGYQPSTLWPAERWTADWLALRLPDAAPAEGDYPLVMRLYDVNTGQALLARRVGVLSWDGGAWRPRPHAPSFTLPDGLTPMEATFGRHAEPYIALRGYRLEHEADALRLTLYWEALADVPYEYTRFVHLIDPGGITAAQIDSAPAGDSYPTRQWLAGEVVADAVTFDLANLPPDEYQLATGFYQPNEGLPRVSAFGPDGPLPDGRVFLPESIIIPMP
jgi:hypothetical protein